MSKMLRFPAYGVFLVIALSTMAWSIEGMVLMVPSWPPDHRNEYPALQENPHAGNGGAGSNWHGLRTLLAQAPPILETEKEAYDRSRNLKQLIGATRIENVNDFQLIVESSRRLLQEKELPTCQINIEYQITDISKTGFDSRLKLVNNGDKDTSWYLNFNYKDYSNLRLENVTDATTLTLGSTDGAPAILVSTFDLSNPLGGLAPRSSVTLDMQTRMVSSPNESASLLIDGVNINDLGCARVFPDPESEDDVFSQKYCTNALSFFNTFGGRPSEPCKAIFCCGKRIKDEKEKIKLPTPMPAITVAPAPELPADVGAPAVEKTEDDTNIGTKDKANDSDKNDTSKQSPVFEPEKNPQRSNTTEESDIVSRETPSPDGMEQARKEEDQKQSTGSETQEKNDSDETSSNAGLIGAIIGVTVVLLISVAILWWFYKRQRKKQRISDTSVTTAKKDIAGTDNADGGQIRRQEYVTNNESISSINTGNPVGMSTLANALSPSTDHGGTLTMQEVTSASTRTFSGGESIDTSGGSCIMKSPDTPGVAAALPQQVTLIERIGEGAFGIVYRGEWAGRAVAVKVMQTSCSTSSKELNSFRQEVAFLSRVRHPNIIAFYAACTVPPNICIIEELAEGGSLHAKLHGVRGARCQAALPLGRLLSIAGDIAQAMAYLHPRIVHRDLKSLNVLLDAEGRAKVCDFGIAKYKDRTFVSTVNGQAGTPTYMAPELFDGGNVTEKVDCYAFGILLWEMLTGKVPWGDVPSPMQIIYYVGVLGQRPPIPSQTPQSLRDLMMSCWADDPATRPSFTEIIAILNEIKVEFESNGKIDEIFGSDSHPISEELEEIDLETDHGDSHTESHTSFDQTLDRDVTASSTFDMFAMNSMASSVTNG